MFSGYSGWWLVVAPDALGISQYTTSGLLEVWAWCNENCSGEWCGSSIYPWMFRLECDATGFLAKWGGTLKPPQN